jgi:hypothetical protein
MFIGPAARHTAVVLGALPTGAFAGIADHVRAPAADLDSRLPTAR